MSRTLWLSVVGTLALFTLMLPGDATACPYCTAGQATFSEELAGADAAVIAVEVRRAEPPAGKSKSDPFAPEPKTKFKVIEVVKGDKLVKIGAEIEVLYFGRQPVGTQFYMTAVDPKMLAWNTPIALNETSLAYLRKLPTLPKEGADRLFFFQDFLESPEEIITRDSYDEFAKAPYEAVKDLKPRMKHGQIVAWVKDNKIPASRRRLYLTMLGVCGGPEDLPMLEKMITSGDQDSKLVLDALLGAYLILRGPDGMDLVDKEYLANPDAKYTDIWSTIQSLRVLGQISQAIPKARLVKSFRLMLERPNLADLVIPDLARWEDWDSTDRLVKLFKDSEDAGSFIRVPVMRFLMANPKPEAKAQLEELKKLDPEAFKRANLFFPGVPSKDTAPATSEADTKLPKAPGEQPDGPKSKVAPPKLDKT